MFVGQQNLVWYMKVGFTIKVNQMIMQGESKDKWVPTSNYITIEIATKPRPQCDLSTFLHKRIHVCLCCYENNWHELEFIKKRVSKQDDSDPDLISYGAYKSQQHRPLDIQ